MYNENKEIFKYIKNLNELCEMLNSLNEIFIKKFVDLSDLPVFSENSPKNTYDIFSYDDENLLIRDSEWNIEPRCTECSEAKFHCSCETL